MTGTKPERRKSQIAGRTFFNSQAEAEAPAAAVPEREAPTPPPSAPERRTSAEATQNDGPKKKLAYYVDDEENGRIRAAFLAGRDKYGWRSFTDFQLSTILDRVAQLEQEFNQGRPFDGVPPKAGQLGRPMS